MLAAWRIFARSIRDLNPGGGMTALADFESAPFDLLGNAPYTILMVYLSSGICEWPQGLL